MSDQARNVRSLVGFDIPALESELADHGFPSSHAKLILREFHARNGSLAVLPERLGTRLPAWLRERFTDRLAHVSHRHQSVDQTIKLLLKMTAGGAVESVLMPGHREDRAAGCVSSQIGCAMGCDFCASTRGGLQRNLAAGEIVEQFLHLKAEAHALGRRLMSLVFMGMGEPMHNLPNVIAAIRQIADPDLGGLGWRQITVSTVGIVPGMDELADADLNVHLALSLHAADDSTRSRIVPMNRRYPVAEIMAAAKRFARRTRRVPTIEYCLLADVNDSSSHAIALAELMDGFRAHVNLIAYNPIEGADHQTPSRQRVIEFLQILRDRRVIAHLRETRGDDVSAACGQLRALGN